LVPRPVASEELGEVVGAGKGGALPVVAAVARSNEVVEPIVAAVALGDEVIDLAAAERGVAVEAGAVLKVEETFGDALERDPVAAEKEVFELKDRELTVGDSAVPPGPLAPGFLMRTPSQLRSARRLLDRCGSPIRCYEPWSMNRCRRFYAPCCTPRRRGFCSGRGSPRRQSLTR
jgi:hypothetical protein